MSDVDPLIRRQAIKSARRVIEADLGRKRRYR